ncbi:hypothetical protein Q5M85_13600 [Paraclostridium bifermentans]|nr:hypothetical protein [Paraclostridium bifermentans]
MIFGEHPYGEAKSEEELIRRMDKGICWRKLTSEKSRKNHKYSKKTVKSKA